MTSRTAGRLAGGMAHGDHIHYENFGFIDANGPAPASAISHRPDLHLGDLSFVDYGGHTARTALRGYIPEHTYLEGPVPLLIAHSGQASRPRDQRTMAHDELARGMASTGHILLGNHVVNHTKGSAPTFALCHGPNLPLKNLGPAAYGGRTLRTAHGGRIP
jgi:hypothetical protein